MVRESNSLFAISNKENINKGGRLKLEREEEVDGSITIFRIFDSIRQQQSSFGRFRRRKLLLSRISEFDPDVIFCEEISNLPLAIKLKCKFKVPIVLRTEFAFDAKNPYRTAGRILRFLKTPLTGDFLAVLLARLLWRWAYGNSDAIISCYFEDARYQPTIQNTPFYYVPWPCFDPAKSPIAERKKNRAVFIGAFDPHKNLAEFLITIPALLAETPLQEFYIVGTGKDSEAVEELKLRFPDSIYHLQSMSREDCLELIESCFFSYSPALRGGWGFIGDSWAMNTPVLATSNHYGFRDEVDTFVATTEEVVEKVNAFYDDPELYDRVRRGGRQRFITNHSADAVGRKYLDVCDVAIKSFP